MVIIRFATVEMRRRALGYLLGRFSGRSWATGEVMVPEPALSYLAAEGITFSVEGPATHDRIFRLDRATSTPTSDHQPAASA